MTEEPDKASKEAVASLRAFFEGLRAQQGSAAYKRTPTRSPLKRR